MTEICIVTELKYFLSGPLQKGFADPQSRTRSPRVRNSANLGGRLPRGKLRDATEKEQDSHWPYVWAGGQRALWAVGAPAWMG